MALALATIRRNDGLPGMTGNKLMAFLSRSGSNWFLPVVSAGILMTVCSIAFSQEAPAIEGQKRTFAVMPRVSVTEILTDNGQLAASGKRSEQITDISPGVRITSDGGRIRGFLDYTLHGRFLAQGTSTSNIQNSLNAFGTLEALEKRVFIDATAGITQQTISALGTQSTLFGANNNNQTETAYSRISPYAVGRLSDYATYEARYSLATNRSASAAVANSSLRESLLSLKGQFAGRAGWSLTGTQRGITYSSSRGTEDDSIVGSVNYAISTQLNVAVSAGVESNNFTSPNQQSSSTSGFTVTWLPSDRTSFSLGRQGHSYGETHNFSAEHRTQRTIWRYTDSQSVTASGGQPGVGSLGTTYDLFFAQFAALEPDTIKRAALVNAFLQANGISPTASVISNFLTSAVSTQRRQDLSLALLGVRDTVTIFASRTESARLDTVTTAVDDLTNSAIVRQSGLGIVYAHKLTPSSALNVSFSSQNSSSSALLADTSNKTLTVGLTTTLGRRTTASANARRVVFESSTSPYNETAFTGTLNVQF